MQRLWKLINYIAFAHITKEQGHKSIEKTTVSIYSPFHVSIQHLLPRIGLR